MKTRELWYPLSVEYGMNPKVCEAGPYAAFAHMALLAMAKKSGRQDGAVARNLWTPNTIRIQLSAFAKLISVKKLSSGINAAISSGLVDAFEIEGKEFVAPHGWGEYNAEIYRATYRMENEKRKLKATTCEEKSFGDKENKPDTNTESLRSKDAVNTSEKPVYITEQNITEQNKENINSISTKTKSNRQEDKNSICDIKLTGHVPTIEDTCEERKSSNPFTQKLLDSFKELDVYNAEQATQKTQTYKEQRDEAVRQILENRPPRYQATCDNTYQHVISKSRTLFARAQEAKAREITRATADNRPQWKINEEDTQEAAYLMDGHRKYVDKDRFERATEIAKKMLFETYPPNGKAPRDAEGKVPPEEMVKIKAIEKEAISDSQKEKCEIEKISEPILQAKIKAEWPSGEPRHSTGGITTAGTRRRLELMREAWIEAKEIYYNK